VLVVVGWRGKRATGGKEERTVAGWDGDCPVVGQGAAPDAEVEGFHDCKTEDAVDGGEFDGEVFREAGSEDGVLAALWHWCLQGHGSPRVKGEGETYVSLQYRINKHALTSHRHATMPCSSATNILLPQTASSLCSRVQPSVSPSST
jgi:hypothetical protein